MIKAVLIDLDGTLVDTAPDITAAACAALADINLPLPDLAEVRQYVGDGMPRFIKRLLTKQWWGEPDAELFRRASERMNIHYANYCVAGRRVYDGVVETLSELRSRKKCLACVTNKPKRFTMPLLEVCGLSAFFTHCVCGDTLPHKKPHPAPLLDACHAYDISTVNAVMVGDSLPDAKAAKAAGCRFVAAAYGYHWEDISAFADATIAGFADLPLVLESMERQCQR